MEDSSAVATIVFFPEGAYGPTNNCVGIGQVLRECGHRVVFVIDIAVAATLSKSHRVDAAETAKEMSPVSCASVPMMPKS